jgi:predicted DNA-binding transcriptional regulator AlpA
MPDNPESPYRRARLLPDWPRAMNEESAAAYVSLSLSSFRTEVSKGRIPKPIKLTLKRKAWLRDDLDGWLDGLAGKIAASAPVEIDDWQRALKANGDRLAAVH